MRRSPDACFSSYCASNHREQIGERGSAALRPHPVVLSDRPRCAEDPSTEMSASRLRVDGSRERVLQLEAGDEPALDSRPVGMADHAMIPHVLAVADLRAL